MNRGLHELASGIKRKVAAVFAPVEPKPHRSGLLRRTLLVTAIGLFAGAAALGMVQQPDRTELPPSRVIQSILPLTAEQVEVSTPSAAPYISETRIRPGDTLSAVLQRLELDAPNLQSFLTHDASARSIYKLYPGRSVQAATDEQGNLVWLRYIHTPGNETDGQVVTRMLHVAPTGDSYKAEEVTESTERQTRVAVGTIKSSLFGATDSAGIPDSVTMQMADILSAKIDFLRDLRQGDQFRVVYEVRSHDGRYAGAGRVLALEFINGGKTYNAVWFSPDEKSGSYYDFDGTSLRGAFLRTALKFSRISSTFGMRMHPITRPGRATRASTTPHRRARRSTPPRTARSNSRAGRMATATSSSSSTTASIRRCTRTRAASPKASPRAPRCRKANCWAMSVPPAGPPVRTCTTSSASTTSPSTRCRWTCPWPAPSNPRKSARSTRRSTPTSSRSSC